MQNMPDIKTCSKQCLSQQMSMQTQKRVLEINITVFTCVR